MKMVVEPVAPDNQLAAGMYSMQCVSLSKVLFISMLATYIHTGGTI